MDVTATGKALGWGEASSTRIWSSSLPQRDRMCTTPLLPQAARRRPSRLQLKSALPPPSSLAGTCSAALAGMLPQAWLLQSFKSPKTLPLCSVCTVAQLIACGYRSCIWLRLEVFKGCPGCISRCWAPWGMARCALLQALLPMFCLSWLPAPAGCVPAPALNRDRQCESQCWRVVWEARSAALLWAAAPHPGAEQAGCVQCLLQQPLAKAWRNCTSAVQGTSPLCHPAPQFSCSPGS